MLDTLFISDHYLLFIDNNFVKNYSQYSLCVIYVLLIYVFVNFQTCVQFLRSNESAVLETVSLAPSGETVELFGDHNTNGNSNTSAYNASRSGTNTIQHLNPASIHHHYSGATNLATKRRISDTP